MANDFYIDLRVGCFIIGYLSLISSVTLTIFSTILLAPTVIMIMALNPEERNALGSVLQICIIYLLIFLLLLAFTIGLLVGLHKQKPGLVKAYLIYGVIFLLLSFILFILTLVHMPTAINATYIAYCVFTLLLGPNFLMVIRSYYCKMLVEYGPQNCTS